mmetsp:Transcript_25883/g.76670  ORF Transcript_25883/g.76670 Transcript_25883/m.76670 type:complete len:223 (-) Transcript_25883:546-1214(-)
MSTLRCLLIDNYDSYTYNLHNILAEVNGAEPVVVTNDAVGLRDVRAMLDEGHVDAIVISPGPGTPTRGADVGRCIRHNAAQQDLLAGPTAAAAAPAGRGRAQGERHTSEEHRPAVDTLAGPRGRAARAEEMLRDEAEQTRRPRPLTAAGRLGEAQTGRCCRAWLVLGRGCHARFGSKIQYQSHYSWPLEQPLSPLLHLPSPSLPSPSLPVCQQVCAWIYLRS